MNKINAMEAFKALVAAIDALPVEVVQAMNPCPGVWNPYNAVIVHVKEGLMQSFGITEEDWDEFFEGWERLS